MRVVLVGLVLICMVGITIAEKPANELGTIYYSYGGNVTKELYIGGYLHFPKKLADRIKVTGGAVEKEDDTGWKIKVTSNAVVVDYVKLTDKDFSYSRKKFVAKEYPAELIKPVKPDEMRMTLIELNKNLNNVTKELKTVKYKVTEISERPTIQEMLVGFFVYSPWMYPIYVIVGILGLLYVLGARW